MLTFIRKKMAALALGAVLAVAGATAHATLITYNLHGNLDFVDSSVTSMFSTGQDVFVSYQFESTTGANPGSNSNFAVFNALTGFNFNIGSYSAVSTAAPEIQVDNDPGAPDDDRYGLVSRASDGLSGAPVAGNVLDAFTFRFDDSSDSVFMDALILPTDLQFSSFDSNSFFVFFRPATGGQAYLALSGTFDSLAPETPVVPEPATLSLIGIGTAGLAAFRRRKRA